MAISARRTERETDRRFPVRVRIAVPAAGFGRQLAVMHAWLDEVCGVGGWATAPAGLVGVVNDAVAFYFTDTAHAHAFVNRFCCGYCTLDAVVDHAFALRRAAPAPTDENR